VRLFQNISAYPAYLRRIDELSARADTDSFAGRRELYLQDRYCALHLLQPVLRNDGMAFFTCCNDEVLQRKWARENGLPSSSSLEQILLAQVEEHRADVFYNMAPVLYPSTFLSQVPSRVQVAIAWRAAPSGNSDFSGYSVVVCNFPSLLKEHERRGCRAAFFFPAVDPAMDAFALNEDRPIDILFVGGFTRHHIRRSALLAGIAKMSESFVVEMHLDRSRFTRLSESPIGRCLPLAKYRRPELIRKQSRDALFGIELYHAMSRAKIVVNCAIDMAGADRGNLRCFESLGCRSLLLSDAGVYPLGMEHEKTFVAYSDVSDAPKLAAELLRDSERCSHIADSGARMVRAIYSKIEQWSAFEAIVHGCSPTGGKR
jgi:hypothetical protein